MKIVCAVIFLAAANKSEAGVLVSNLSEPPTIFFVGLNDVVFSAAGFSTRTVGAFLEGASAEVSSNQGTTLFAEIRIDDNDSPGALFEDLGTFTFNQSGLQLASFSASGTQRLNRDASYWLVLGTTGGGANWPVTFSSNEFSPFGWTIDQRTQSNDGGLTWLPARTDSFPRFSISGSVPEPSAVATWILLGLCTGIVGVGRRLDALPRAVKKLKRAFWPKECETG